MVLSLRKILLVCGTVKRAEQLDQENPECKEFIEVDKITTSLQRAIKGLENKNTQEVLFIQTLSHQLRTPMVIVQIAIELLAKKELNDNVREKLGIIFDSNQKMQYLSNDLLSLWTETQVDNGNERNQQTLQESK